MIYLGKDGTVDGQRPKQLKQRFSDDKVVVGANETQLKTWLRERCEPAASAALMKTVLYCRVSTLDQTLDHQRIQAEAAGFRLDDVVADHGISGVQTALRARPEGRRLFDMLRTGDTLVVRWVDRLGRNYADVRRGIIIRTVINGLTFDGSSKDPMTQAVRDSLIAFMAAMAQAQAEVTKSGAFFMWMEKCR